MNYQEALKYLNSFINYEQIDSYSYNASFKLERMASFLEDIGNPQDKFKSVHIAGTKGKGSTAAFTYSILKEAGLKVGLYTSPHLVSFRERIRINSKSFEEELIKKEEVGEILEYLKIKIDKFNRKSKLGNLTFFEVYTALAFIYFAGKNVDIAVLETGLGGRLDATNTVKPLACAITPVSFDHMDKLGDTLSLIAREKAGIVKNKTPVITAPQEEEAMEVIEQVCLEKEAKLYKVGADILWDKVSDNSNGFTPNRQRSDLPGSGQVFNLKGIFGEYPSIRIPLLGEHQIINAAVALGLVELLKERGIFTSEENIAKGFDNVYWPGRLQVISDEPLIILDGAQNLASASILKKAIAENFSSKKIILILGISADKDIENIGKILCPLANDVIFTKAASPRAAKPELLQGRLKPYCKNYILADSVKTALDKAQENYRKDTLILVAGSLYLVGEALKIYGKN